MAVSTFYSQIILHRRLLCPDSPPTSIHRQATAGIVDISRKQMASDPRLLRRLHWPLLAALIFHSEFVWANELADEILARQDVSQGHYVNLAELLLQRLQVQ